MFQADLCIDKIPRVTKTKVSKPKRYSLSKLRLCHAPLELLIHTRSHMSTSRCGNICVMQPKYSRKGVVSVTAVVLKQLYQEEAVFLGKSNLFGVSKVDAFKNH